MAKIKTIGILTSGGDAPGMNAAIRAVTRSAIYNGFNVKGIYRGYKGLITDEIVDFKTQNVSNIIQQGGTILKTARCKEFTTPEGRQIAYENMRKHEIDALEADLKANKARQKADPTNADLKSEAQQKKNELTALKCSKKAILEPMVVLLSPFAPHIAEELWEALGHDTTVCDAAFPEYVEAYTVENNCTYAVSFNGKTRFTVDLPKSMGKDEVEAQVRGLEQTAKYVEGLSIVKVIVVPGKIVNIVVK